MPPAPATSADALTQMTQAQGQMQDPSAIMAGEQQSLGVPQAQQQVSGLRAAITNTTNLLNNVAPSVQGRAANSLVTSAQANRQIQNESAPIAKTLGDQTQQEAMAESDLKDTEGRAASNAQLKNQGQDQKLGFLKNVYDALFNKEQASAKSQSDAQALALEQQKLAEQVRSNKAGESIAAGKVATPSPAEVKQADMGGAAQYLQSQVGKDGHVSQSTWNNAIAKWLAAGYSQKDFTNQFIQYVNQRYAGYHGYN